MIKTLWMVGIFALVFSGVVLVFWVMECFQIAPVAGGEAELSIVEKFKRSESCSDKSRQMVSSPLVQQAQAFALYLNPPARPVQNPKPSIPAAKHVVKKEPEVEPVQMSPKFEVRGISYYPSRPEESMALVWEPGSGCRWIKKGAKLGHFVVERIEGASVLYRDGQNTHEMAFVPGQAATGVARDNNIKPVPKESRKPDRAPRPSPLQRARRTPSTRVVVKSTSG